jgi:hypothetical protein
MSFPARHQELLVDLESDLEGLVAQRSALKTALKPSTSSTTSSESRCWVATRGGSFIALPKSNQMLEQELANVETEIRELCLRVQQATSSGQ